MHGIDLSPDMVEQLLSKPGADAIGVTVGDFATRGGWMRDVLAGLPGAQHDHEPDDAGRRRWPASPTSPPIWRRAGASSIEVMVPELRRLPPGETVRAFTVTPTHLGFEEYDVATQRSGPTTTGSATGRSRHSRAPFRYVWPAELDLMARLAGMTLRERWNDWDRSPFTSESRSHVSVWEKATAGAGSSGPGAPR